jgi:hypothetical protein
VESLAISNIELIRTCRSTWGVHVYWIMTPHREQISAVVIWVKNMTRWMRTKRNVKEDREKIEEKGEIKVKRVK